MLTFFLQNCLSARIPYPYSIINAYTCNINGYIYNLEKFANQPTPEKFIVDDYQYYFRIGKALSVEELPDYCSNVDLVDVQAVRCNDQKRTCQPFLYITDFDWKPYLASNFTEGVIYYAEGQPFQIESDQNEEQFMTIDIAFQIESDLQEEIPSWIKTNISVTNYLSIIYQGKSKYAIPKIDQIPPPTPTPYIPDCRFSARSSDTDQYGFDVFLDQLNGGPYGNRVPLSINNENYTLFYQPCERMKCPTNFQCQSTELELSSVWLCDSNRSCTSYGLGKEFINLQLISEDPAITIQSFDTEKTFKTNTTITCGQKPMYPDNHIVFDNQATILDNVLQLTAKSEEVCMKEMPTPQPSHNKCSFHISIDDYYIGIDLFRHNTQDQIGYTKKVQLITPVPGISDPLLIYQPCGASYCPDGAFCEGDEDADIWLCWKENNTDYCRSFGYVNNSIDINLETYGDIHSGLEIDYYNDHRKGKVYLHCDYSVPQLGILLPDEVNLSTDGNNIQFTAYSVGACSVGPAVWYPPSDSIVQPTDPTPTPQPSPNPIDFVENGTHYIYTNLDDLYQQIYRGETKLWFPGAKKDNLSKWYVEYHPWDPVSCPIGYDCLGFQSANIWACWIDVAAGNKKICFPVANVHYGNDMEAMDLSDLEMGAKIYYKGAWDIETRLDVHCDSAKEQNQIAFDDETFANWISGGLSTFRKFNNIKKNDKNNIVVTFDLDSGYVCPLKFRNPVFPQTPEQTPVPRKYEGQTIFSTPRIDSLQVAFDLKDIQSIDTYSAVGYRGNLYKSRFIYNPYDKQDCPKPYECLGGSKSNVWLCSNYSNSRQACVPIGDIDAGLECDAENLTNLMEGITLSYLGGYGERETRVTFQCNSSLGNQMRVDPVILARQPGIIHIVRIQTGIVCPVQDMKERVTGGSIFLFIVFLIIMGYFSVGLLLNFGLNGEVKFLNHDFWIGFYWAFGAAFSCGNRLGPEYDYI